MQTAEIIGFPRGVTPEAIIRLVERIRPILESQVFPLLKGHPPEMQGCVLADLLAIWLAGHHVPNDAGATRTMRAELLAMHCSQVRFLTSTNAKMIGTMP
jgi:hypothetical protein